MVDLYFCAVESHWEEHSVETGMKGWFMAMMALWLEENTGSVSVHHFGNPVSPQATTNYCVTLMLKKMSAFRSMDSWDHVKHDSSWGNLQESAHLWRFEKEMILTLLTGHILRRHSSQLGYICLQPGHTANSCSLVRPGPSSQVLKQKLQKLQSITIPTVNLTTEM